MGQLTRIPCSQLKALVVEHDPLSTPERVGDHLESRGIALDHLVVVADIGDPEVTAVFPDRGHDLVVLMGAPWSAYEPRVQGWVRPEIDFVRVQLARGMPVLGICFGAQIMSASLGGEVVPASIPEYGWGSIGSDVSTIADGPWFQYHGDEFTLPPNASLLAANESGVQAFRHERSLAVQFHPEVTGSLIGSWCAVGGDKKLIEAGIDPEQLIEETIGLAEASQPALERMVDWWLEGLP